MSKQEIIGNIYFDKAGFGSRKTTLQDAKDKDPTITMKDVEEFFKKMLKSRRTPEDGTASLPLTIITLIKWIYFLFQKKI